MLLILVFGKDLGKRNTWIIFGIFLALDLIQIVFVAFRPNFLPYTLSGIFSRLLTAITLGLAIRGKYADKDARGTV